VLDIAPQTVANHLTMALADLRTALSPYFYEEWAPSTHAMEDQQLNLTA
jgi:hypothetical protein